MAESSEKHYRMSIRRPVTVAMIFLTLLVFGWKSYQQLPLNLMPDISYPTLTVRSEYEGAAPQDVVELLTKPLEERLSVVSGLVELNSVSSAGLSEIVLEFTWGTDMDVAMQDVRETLDSFTGPQDLTRRPIILRYDPTLDPVMRIAITGRDFAEVTNSMLREERIRADLTTIRTAAERQLKNDLEAEVGIAQIEIQGGREEEIRILVDSERAKNVNLPLSAIHTALEQQNINRSGGRLREGQTEYLVRTLNEFQDVEEIKEVIVSAGSGEHYRLDELAQVFLGEKERETIVRVNGQEAVELKIYKEGDANTVQVCDKLKRFFAFESTDSFVAKILRRMAEQSPPERREAMLAKLDAPDPMAERLKSRLPQYAELTLISDQSRFIEASVNEVRQTAIVGGLLALCVLFLFLKDVKSTAIIGVAIPISVIAAFIPMFMRDVSLNIMSLGGLALGVGMLVDNSIVVLESIFRCKEEGDGTIDAAERGTKEVSGAVTAATLTTIAVFAPIIFVEGIAGQLFRDLALTVTFSLIASLIVALYLIPMVASRVRKSYAPEEQAVWVLRGYYEGREAGKGRFGSMLGIVGRAPRYVREGFVDTWVGTAGPAISIALGKKVYEESKWRRVLRRVGAFALTPVVVALFVVQMALKTGATLIVTALCAATIGILAGLWMLAKGLHILLYLPVRVFDKTFGATRAMYTVALRGALHFSPLIVVGIAVLAYFAAVEATRLGQELIPPMKQGEFTIRMEAPPGTRLEDTEKRAELIEAVVRDFAYVESVTMQVGNEVSSGTEQEGENVAFLTVKLENPEQNAQIQDEVIEKMRLAITSITPDEISFSLPTLFSFKTAVELQIFGEDLERLRVLGQDAVRQISAIEGVRDAELSLKRGYPELLIEMDNEMVAEIGKTPAQVAQLVSREVEGEIATRFNDGGDKIDIRVQADEAKLGSVQDLMAMSVTDSFPPTPLSAVARVTQVEGPSEVRRIDQRNVVTISANVEGRDLGSVAAEFESVLDADLWPPGYSYRMGGQQRELATSYNGLIFALAMAVFLVYVVMACQFESLWHPALIMFSVPLAFVGVIYTLKWFQVDVSVVVFIGGIVLSGIVVNAAIVLVDYINQLRRRGMSKIDAIVQAGSVRFRPILMTTTTTVLGLIPMVMSTGEGAEIRGPMAITVMAGLISGTILTLFVIPVVYYVAGGRDPKPLEG